MKNLVAAQESDGDQQLRRWVGAFGRSGRRWTGDRLAQQIGEELTI
jgi:hypothetical protein